MDDQGNKGYSGEEHFYNQQQPVNSQAFTSPPYSSGLGPQKIQPLEPKKSFGQRFLWLLIGLALVILLAAVVGGVVIKQASSSSSPNSAGVSSSQPSPTQSIPTQIAVLPTPTPTDTAATPDATPTVTPAITPTVPPTSGLPCVVNISTWTGGSPDWVVHNGVLYNDGTNDVNNGPTIIAPCEPGVPNYAVQATIRVTGNGGNCFGIVLRGQSGQNGWQGYRTDVCRGNTSYIVAYGEGNPLTQAPFSPGTTSHTYRAVVQDNTIKFFIDGNLVDTATDNRLLTTETGLGVGLFSQNIQLQVTSFQVTAV